MPDLGTSFELYLQTNNPSTPVLRFVDHTLDTTTVWSAVPFTLTNTVAAIGGVTPATQMKIYGCKGDVTKILTGDGTTTSFTYDSDANADHYDTSVTPVVKVDDVVVSATTSTFGVVVFDTAPADGAVIKVEYSKLVMLEADASWEAYSASFTKPLDRDTVEDAGTVTVYAKIRDDVYNTSPEASDVASIDTEPPVVAIQSITLGDGSYTTTPTYKISDEAGRDTVTIVFQSSEAFVAWKAVKVASTSTTQDAGVAIPETYGSTTHAESVSIAADTDTTCVIKGRDLQSAVTDDGNYVIKIFVQDAAGNWSL